MGLKVIGAGFGRTGTLSLKFALEKLGFDKCYHMMEIPLVPEHIPLWRAAAAGQSVDWESLFEGYQAAVDWPSCNFWRQQLQVFPEAKVILTRRDPEQWYSSVMHTIWLSSEQGRMDLADAEMTELVEHEGRDRIKMVYEVIWDGVFGLRMEDKKHVMQCFERHNQSVINSVPAEQLLVIEPGDGWSPLCEFLEVEGPDAEYPRINSKGDFQKRFLSNATPSGESH
ncbi:MAG: sulfotransferase family protein [Proteobacteria bacterium]|nr:sulfotransferase family protein [Pseudomonadota bacterium]